LTQFFIVIQSINGIILTFLFSLGINEQINFVNNFLCKSSLFNLSSGAEKWFEWHLSTLYSPWNIVWKVRADVEEKLKRRTCTNFPDNPILLIEFFLRRWFCVLIPELKLNKPNINDKFLTSWLFRYRPMPPARPPPPPPLRLPRRTHSRKLN